jgi:catalase-peroxidase
MGLGWTNHHGTGRGADTITSGLEGAWTPTPTTWDNSFFDTLFGYEWQLTSSPAGAHRGSPPTDRERQCPDAPTRPTASAVMLTTDWP